MENIFTGMIDNNWWPQVMQDINIRWHFIKTYYKTSTQIKK